MSQSGSIIKRHELITKTFLYPFQQANFDLNQTVAKIMQPECQKYALLSGISSNINVLKNQRPAAQEHLRVNPPDYG